MLYKKKRVAILSIVAFFYTVFYLIGIRDIKITSIDNISFTAGNLANIFRSTGSFQFEPIYRIIIPPVSIFISPVNILIGLILGTLVGINVLLIYLLLNSPKSCKISESAGLVSSVPAIISGTACCGPIIFIIFGIQATGLIISVFQILIPLSFILLSVSSYLVYRRLEIEHL